MDWTALLDGPSIEDQQNLLAQKIKRAQELGAPQQHTTGIGTLLGGIGQILMGRKERDLRDQQMALAGQAGNHRSEYLRAMLGEPDERRQMIMGAAGGMMGDPAMAQFGQSMAGMPRARLDLALEQQKLANEGPQADLGGKTRAIFEALTKRQEVPKFAPNPVSGALYNVRTGAETAGAPGGAAYDKRLPMMQEKFAKDLDPNNFRSGVLKGNQERSNAAERLLQLAVDPITGGPADLNPQQMTELSTSLAALLSGGGGGSEGQRHELTPYTKGRSFANLMQWLTDKPQGADQKAFVQQMIDTAKREKGVVEGQIRGAQSQRFANHLPFMSMFPDAAKSQLQAYGFDPSEVDFKTGKYSPKAKAPAAANSATRRTVNGKTYEKRADGWYEVTQ